MERNLCFGIEFWPENKFEGNNNCLECGTDSSKSYTISVVANPIKSKRGGPVIRPGRANGKNTGPRQIIDTDRLNWATVYGKVIGDNDGTIKPESANGKNTGPRQIIDVDRPTYGKAK